MKKEGIKLIAKNLGGVISKNSPTILTSLTVGGLVTTSILAIKATPKALEILCEERIRREEEIDKKGIGNYTSEECRYVDILSKREIIQLTWRVYLPAIGVGLATIACVIGANSIHLRRNAALGAVYSLTESAFKEYQAKVTETLGNNKEIKLRDEIAKDRVERKSIDTNEIIFTGKGDVLCLDSISGRLFESDIEKIRQVENRMTRALRDEMFISLNEVYYELGLKPTKLGDLMGWSMDDGDIEFSYSSQLTENGRPCLVLDYDIVPKFTYGDQ